MYLTVLAAVAVTAASGAPFRFPAMPTASHLRAPASADSFAGTYLGKADDAAATLRLTQEGDAVTGTLTLEGETISLSGTASEDRVTGTATMPDVPVPLGFDLRREGAAALKFALVFDGRRDPDTEIVFTSGGGGGGVAASGRPAAPAKPVGATAVTANAAPKATTSRKGMKTYRHPAGLSLQYPAAWTAKEAGDLLALVPTGAQKDAQGKALEAYVARAESARGLNDAKDPRVAQAFDGLVARSAPYMRRVGEPKPARTAAGDGAVLVYEGTAPDGQVYQVRVYAAVAGDLLVTLMAQAPKAKMAARRGDVEAMFGSIRGGGAAEMDPALVGTWTGRLNDNGRLIGNASTGLTTQVASDSQTRYTLAADGTIVASTRRRTIVNHPGASLDTGDYEEKTTGRWSAGGGRLFIAWQDGTSLTVPYRVQGNRIVLNDGAGVFTRAE